MLLAHLCASIIEWGKSNMTKEEALEYIGRWEPVNQFVLNEIRQLSVGEKLGQLDQLYLFAREMSWFDRMPDDESEAKNSIWIKAKILYERTVESAN